MLLTWVVYHLVRKIGWSKVAVNGMHQNPTVNGRYHLNGNFHATCPLTFPQGQIQVERCGTSSKSKILNGMHIFCLEIPFGKFGLPFKKSCFLRKFSGWEDQIRPHSNLVLLPGHGARALEWTFRHASAVILACSQMTRKRS